MSDKPSAVLRVDGLKAFYGNVEALHGVSLDVGRGELVAVLGPNGAGKSTLLKAVMGLVRAEGSIMFDGHSIDGLSTRERAIMGMVLVPEGRAVLAPLTVQENLELGAYSRWGKVPKSEIEADLESVFRLFPILKERLKQLAGLLSGGQQQMLAIGRAVMGRPDLLLLDEPSLGLAPLIIQEIFEKLGTLNREGITILLVEQKAPLVLDMADHAYVLRSGIVAADMTQEELKSTDNLGKLYLGTLE